MKHYSPAVARNREPLAEVLGRVLPERAAVLEIASGSGEHAAFFAGRFPALSWQPSDADPISLASIEAHRREDNRPNLMPPIRLDVLDPWASQLESAIDAIFCANMIHIAPWACCLGLLSGAAAVLAPGGLLVLYGPFFRDGVETAPSNLAFDDSLRARDPSWGVRRLEDVVEAAAGFELAEIVEMPANNLTVVLRRGER